MPQPTTRAIRLSRIHAINWYGYQDTLPVQGNLVLAGVTGSGKSILMDLIMLVLVGPERARHHFNRSATGTQSDRTIKGYCLLDTKREVNGQPQYYHDKGVTTYLGLEFTWPDGQRVETWGLRIEFRNPAENDGHITPFFCPGVLQKDDFIAVSEEDGKRRARDVNSFRTLLEAHGGRTYPSSREYLRDMHNAAHLNYNREVLDRLLPSAMSFTNLKSFDDFCRRFVLPSEALQIDDVITSYRDFQSYERELSQLRGQLTRLQTISSLASTRAASQIDRETARYLVAELQHEHAQSLVMSMEGRLTKLRSDYAQDEQRLVDLDRQILDGRRERERLLALINESSEGRLYHQLTEQCERLEADIEKLRSLTMRIDERLRKRSQSAREWLKELRRAPLTTTLDTSRLEQAITDLDTAEVENTASALAELREAAESLVNALRKGFAAETEELRRTRAELAEVESQIATLRSGLPPIPQPLLTALNHALLPTAGLPTARALRELCEVNDEAWREAIEVAFTEKFAVIVPEQHYAEALRIYHDLKPTAHGQRAAVESLIHPARALAAKAKVAKGSLAEKISTHDPIARAVVDELFGQVICVQRLSDFDKHSGAILPDGLMLRGTTLARARHYDGLPFIGKGGLKRQMEVKAGQLADLDARVRRLEPLETEIQRLTLDKDRQVPDFSDISGDLVRLEQLPARKTEHEALMLKLKAMDADAFQSLEDQAFQMQQQVEAWEQEKFDIAKKGGHREIEQNEKTLASRKAEAAKLEDDYFRARRENPTPNLERYHAWKAAFQERFLVPDAMAREFEKEERKAAEAAMKAEGDLRVAMIDFKKTFAPKFDELPEDGRTTAGYEKLLSKIDGQGIPEFEAKAIAEKGRWEQLFRTQVLSRMQHALKRVEDIIFLLNKQLKRPIGHDLYKVEKRNNPDYRFYRQLIDLNSLQQPDDLFFNSVEGELKDALDTFLKTLVENAHSPEASRLLDYRQYFDYDLIVTDVRDPSARPVSVDKQSGKMSGGENQSPYFVAILASYLHAYNRHEERKKEPSLALVPIDEAFSKLSGERIQDCLSAMQELDLQGVFSMSSGNIPFAFSLCDELIVVTKREERTGQKSRVRNVPSILFRDTPEGKEWMERHAG